MVVSEELTINNKEMIKYYSNQNKYIRKVGTNEEYGEAIDLKTSNFKYEETDKDIENIEE